MSKAAGHHKYRSLHKSSATFAEETASCPSPHPVTLITEMRDLLLAVVLSVIISQNPTKGSPSIGREQDFWASRSKQIPLLALNRPNLDNSQNQNVPQQQPFLFGSPQSLYLKDDLTNDIMMKNILEKQNPILLIAWNLNEPDNRNKDLECTSIKCMRRHFGWKVQEPFYVDEPRFIEISTDYKDSLSPGLNDPFVASRGKKLQNKRFDSSQDEFLMNHVRSAESLKNLEISKKSLQDVEKLVGSFDDPFFVSRGKREKEVTKNSDISLKFLNLEDDPFFVSRGKRERDKTFGKNGDYILEKFLGKNDPFFVSRGKKKFQNIEPVRNFSKFLTGNQIIKYNEKQESMENKFNDKHYTNLISNIGRYLEKNDPIYFNGVRGELHKNENENLNKKVDTNIFNYKSRGKRSISENIKKKSEIENKNWPNPLADPFFVTRGKKVSDPINYLSIQNDYLPLKTFNNFRKKSNVPSKGENEKQIDGLIKNFNVDDPFFISRGKKNLENFHSPSQKMYDSTRQESSKNKNTSDFKKEMFESKNDEEFFTSLYLNNKKGPDNYNRENIGKFEDQSGEKTNVLNDRESSSLSGLNGYKNNREKRNRCKNNSCLRKSGKVEEYETEDDLDSENEKLMEEVERVILGSSYVEPRDKHSDLLDILDESFIISRGKKSKGLQDHILQNALDINYQQNLIYKNEILKDFLLSRGILQKLMESYSLDPDEFISK
ncbi:uncharacterized protein PF3D7_1120600 [Prorops nasuta]|uniref:uncharacterized protein PF3D7_1120600 n=1 Tax=Prorops nasuta TaxID=863751 RepID=UPI0034D019C2